MTYEELEEKLDDADAKIAVCLFNEDFISSELVNEWNTIIRQMRELTEEESRKEDAIAKILGKTSTAQSPDAESVGEGD